MSRDDVFNRTIEDYDPKALAKTVNFSEHRFVSIEQDATTGDHYAKGHKSLRGACSHMARTVEEGDTFVPKSIIDLDTGELHELDLFAFVAPKSVDAVAVMMPRNLAESVAGTLQGYPQLETHQAALKLFKQAIDRR